MKNWITLPFVIFQPSDRRILNFATCGLSGSFDEYFKKLETCFAK